ncbi:hypothetical protein ERJ75_001321000 [Trypanosoma vivax]|uniref:Uncharacterized protein n=1 Tax=Trypanosoma vivax (strain Y486) TaxID=1055687 RepID=G0U0U3_TRYVY|nr:hypothetical protein TRVL_07316 [Trypanosoma vivax]KAH8608295.1 hypothetical protein ERJ75_001321000 [Trypanosoma vivax]CCC49693.1 conserved hypothetical protein, unlikey [Trypanosoma vivax Y486]
MPPKGRRPRASASDTMRMAIHRRLETPVGSNGSTTRVVARRSDLVSLPPPAWKRRRAPRLGIGALRVGHRSASGARRGHYKKQRLVCTECRLNMLDWPYCGMTGNPHEFDVEDEPDVIA